MMDYRLRYRIQFRIQRREPTSEWLHNSSMCVLRIRNGNFLLSPTVHKFFNFQEAFLVDKLSNVANAEPRHCVVHTVAQ